MSENDELRIATVEIKEFKRLEFLEVTLPKSGLVVFGGDNGQGKTSALDALAVAFGGDGFKPSNPTRDGSKTPADIEVKTTNGLIVRRSGQNLSLSVKTEAGMKGGQNTLNEFLDKKMLDLPAIRRQSAKAKADTLLKIAGVGTELKTLDDACAAAYDKRRDAGLIAKQAEAELASMDYHPDAPDEEVSVADLSAEIVDANLLNSGLEGLRGERKRCLNEVDDLERREKEIRALMGDQWSRINLIDLDISEKTEIDTAPIKARLDSAETDNEKVRANATRADKEVDAKVKRDAHAALETEVSEAREAREALLDGAEMPLAGLSIEDGELTFGGQKEDCWSGSESLKVWAAIASKLSPKCQFVLLGEVSEFDLKTLVEFDQWCLDNDLQAIATRPSTGDECTFVVDDGKIVRAPDPPKGEGHE